MPPKIIREIPIDGQHDRTAVFGAGVRLADEAIEVARKTVMVMAPVFDLGNVMQDGFDSGAARNWTLGHRRNESRAKRCAASRRSSSGGWFPNDTTDSIGSFLPSFVGYPPISRKLRAPASAGMRTSLR